MRLTSLLAAGLVFLGFSSTSFAGAANLTIDGKSNVFAAGRVAPFGGGVLPPSVRFAAGAGKVLTISGVSGTTTCIANVAPLGPDGGSCGGYKETHIDSYKGISGIRHKDRAMFLIGVFTTDAEPADPAPPILDFTGNDAFATLAPQINQTFFLGDGMTGTGSGTRQQFQVPATATRLFLGFADGLFFFDAPGGYENNSGSLAATVDISGATLIVGGTTGAEITGSTFNVPGTSNIYAAGRPTAFNGTLPPFARFSPSPNKVVTFSSASGMISCCGGAPDVGPDGTTAGPTDITAYRGISGIRNDRRTLFLVGVFLDDTEPADPSPPTLDFTNNMAFATFSPQLRQTFFIGDGLTGAGSGTAQQFVVPPAATRLFLGFADGYNGRGAPGYFDDNRGSITIAFQVAGGSACSYAISPAAATYDYRGGNGSVQVSTPGACSWAANTNAGWLRINTPARNDGPATLQYSVEQNDTGLARTGTLTIAGNTFTVTQTGLASCTYSLGMDKLTVGAEAGSYVLQIRTGPACAWTATATVPWITLTTATGKGEGFIRFQVTANPAGPPRVGTIDAAGLTFRLTQSGTLNTCSYQLSSSSVRVPADGATGKITVYAPEGCQWSARSDAAWIALLSAATGSFVGDVQYRADRNTASSPRTGTMTIASQTVTFTQDAAPAASSVEITDVTNDVDLTPAFAPGSVVIISGRNFASAAKQLDEGVPWPGTLQGVSVEVTSGGRTLLAPVGGVAQGWVFVQLPFGISSSADLRVVAPAGRSAARTIPIAERSPRLYAADGSGKGPVWAYHPDNNPVTAAAPAKPGEDILIIGAGFGAVTPPAQAGQLGIDPASGAEPNRVSATVEVEIQGITVRPKLAILDYYLVAAYIVVFTVPDQVSSQSTSLLVRVGGAASQSGISLLVAPKTGPGGCTYSVSPSSLSVPAAGGAGSLTVTTAAACAWTALSNQAWLKITSGASGTGAGTVRYSADPSTSSSPRTATLTVGGQTVTVTQEGTAPSTTTCTYALSPAWARTAAAGGAGTVSVTAGAGCAWDAISTESWLKITAGSSGSGNGTVRYSADAHTSPDPRTAYLVIADQNFALVQDAYQPPPLPVISTDGVVNTADFSPGLAPGSLIAIYGVNLAPSSKQTAELPWPPNLEGVSVEIQQGEQTLYAPVLSVAPEVIKAQLPYGIEGEFRLRVRTGQGLSEPRTITLAARAPRVLRQVDGAALLRHADSSLVTKASPAAAGETVSLFAVGLGAVSPSIAAGQPAGDDAQGGSRSRVSEDVAVELNGAPLEVLFAGLAPGEVGLYRIDFKVPTGAGLGFAPVRVKIGEASSQDEVAVSVMPALRRLWAGAIEPGGGTISTPEFTLTFPASVLPRAAELTVDAAAYGPPAFFVSGLPADLDGEITVSIVQPGEPPSPGTVFIVFGDANGDDIPFPATAEGTRVSAVIPFRSSGLQSGAKVRAAASTPRPPRDWAVFNTTRGRTVNGLKGLAKVEVVLDSQTAHLDDWVNSPGVQRGLEEIADAAERAYLSATAMGIPPIGQFYLPMQIRILNRRGLSWLMAWHRQFPWMEDVALADITGRTTGAMEFVIELDLALGSELDGLRRVDPRLLQKTPHLVVQRMINELDFTVTLDESLRGVLRQRPWEWFHEAVAGWFERKAWRPGGPLFPYTRWQSNQYAGPRRPPGGVTDNYLAQATYQLLTRYAQLTSQRGLDWPNSPSQTLPESPTEKQLAILAYGLNAAPLIDFLDSRLGKSNPSWLGDLYRGAKAQNAFDRGPVAFLRGYLPTVYPGGLDKLWREFIQQYSSGAIYQDVRPDEYPRTRTYLSEFGGLVDAGNTGPDPGLLSMARMTEASFPANDYSALLYVTDPLGPYDAVLASFGRMVVDTKSNTGAVAHISQCKGDQGCAYQVLPPGPWLKAGFTRDPVAFEKSWFAAAVIQPGSEVADRDPVKVRIGVERTVTRDRLMKATGLSCTLGGAFTCSAGDCPPALGLQIRPGGGGYQWECNAATGQCWAKSFSSGSSSNSTASFVLGDNSTLKSLVATDTAYFDLFTITSGFKLLNSAPSEYRIESGEGTTFQITFEGGDVREYNWTKRYADKDKLPSRMTGATFSNPVCSFYGVPEQRPWP